MFTLSSDALKWISRNARPRWLWIGIAALGVGFYVWSAIPEKYQTMLVDYAFERVTRPQPTIDLEIGDFSVPGDAKDDLVWLKAKVERNLVELFIENDRKTAHRLTVLTSGKGRHPTLSGEITEAGSEDVEISSQFVDGTGAVLASTSLVAPMQFLKDHYKAIPETIVYGLDIGYNSLAPLSTKARPTTSLPAYMLYVEARRAAAQDDLEGTLAHLDAAVQIDANFAAAHDAAAEILRALGRAEEANQRTALADSINLDRPRLPILPGVAKPLPTVLGSLQKHSWRPIDTGLSQKLVRVNDYGILIVAWRLDPAQYRMRVAIQNDPRGTAVRDLRASEEAVLAVNGGFFDIDREGRLSPSGYLASQGRRVSALREGGGSAVLYQRADKINIAWSKETNSFADAADAVQAGPMLVDPGGKNGIYRNDFSRHDRTAICMSDAAVVVVIVKGGLSLFELGAVLAASEKDGGFACERAINLDGGPSTQASLVTGKHSVEVEGTWRSQNAVLFVRK